MSKIFQWNKRRRSNYVAVSRMRRPSMRHASETMSPIRRMWPVLSVVIVLSYLVVSGQLGLWRMVSLWQVREDLRDQQRELTAQVVDLDIRKQLLESDTLFIEQVARTEYNLSRPGETVYDLVPEQ